MFVVSTEALQCCIENSTDGTVEEGGAIVPPADGRAGETSGELTVARAVEVSVGSRKLWVE